MQAPQQKDRFRLSRNLGAIVASCALAAFTTFVLLDTFVISRVQQSVQEADLSRKTFYRLFSDKEAVLMLFFKGLFEFCKIC